MRPSGPSLRRAAERLDLDALASLLHDEVEFSPPASGRLVFSGRDDVLLVFGAAFSLFDEVTCRAELTDDSRVVLVLDCRFGRLSLTDAVLMELTEDGLVRRVQPHLRPWPSSTIFIARVAARLCRHPRIFLRAFSRPA